MVEVMLFAPVKGQSIAFWKLFSLAVGDCGRLSIVGNMACCIDRLSCIHTRPDIVVLFPMNRRELAALEKIKDLLARVKIIVVVPDDQSETIRMGHALHPRYLSFADGDLSDVSAVLGKMVNNINRENSQNAVELSN